MYSCYIATLSDNALLSRPPLRFARQLTRIPLTDEISPDPTDSNLNGSTCF